LKILFLSPTGALGGAERILLDLLESVRQARPEWQLELLTLGEGGLNELAQDIGVTVHSQPVSRSISRLGDAGAGGPAGNRISKIRLAVAICSSVNGVASCIWKLRRFIDKHAPDVIHSNGLKTHILAAAATPPRTPVIWHVHDYVSPRPLMSLLMRVQAGHCKAAIANSNSVASDLKHVCGVKLKITTVYNALDLARFNPEGPVLDLDRACALPPARDGVIRVGLVATAARWKGHDVFLRALAMLPDQRYRGYIIGGPIYGTRGSEYTLAELRSMARALGIEDRIGFTGFVDQPAAAMRALDIVVHASTRPEPFGLVVVEAMACGRPVVVSRSGGVAELVRDNENALSFRPGDAATMSACIERLAADAGLRRRLGVQARQWTEQRFDRSRLAEEIIPIYQSLTDGGQVRLGQPLAADS
jgi:glycosyltransferase involved in cell wall biosynthesis